MVVLHTASGALRTIWQPISEKRFFGNVEQVHRASGQVAAKPHPYCRDHNNGAGEGYRLDSNSEYWLAQDFAFIAACDETPNSVSATTITEKPDGTGIIFNVASNRGVSQVSRAIFGIICESLGRCARKEITIEDSVDNIFDQIVRLDRIKIIGRIKCEGWKSFKQGIDRQAFHKTFNITLDHIYSANEGMQEKSKILLSRLRSFVSYVTQADKTLIGSHEGLKDILRAAGQAYDTEQSLIALCGDLGIALEPRDEKAIRTLEKIANYWRLCGRLARIAGSKRYRRLFGQVSLNFLEPYERRKVGNVSRNVHAEVQLATHHRLRKISPFPRTIGTSKAACYLCNLFLSYHPQYSISATHGKIYEIWTIPDLLEYTKKDRKALRTMIMQMNDTLERWVKTELLRGLQTAPESAIFQTPALPSLAGTVLSHAGPIAGAARSTRLESIVDQYKEALPKADFQRSSGEPYVSVVTDKEAELGVMGEVSSFRGLSDKKTTKELKNNRSLDMVSPIDVQLPTAERKQTGELSVYLHNPLTNRGSSVTSRVQQDKADREKPTEGNNTTEKNSKTVASDLPRRLIERGYSESGKSMLSSEKKNSIKEQGRVFLDRGKPLCVGFKSHRGSAQPFGVIKMNQPTSQAQTRIDITSSNRGLEDNRLGIIQAIGTQSRRSPQDLALVEISPSKTHDVLSDSILEVREASEAKRQHEKQRRRNSEDKVYHRSRRRKHSRRSRNLDPNKDHVSRKVRKHIYRHNSHRTTHRKRRVYKRENLSFSQRLQTTLRGFRRLFCG